MYYCSVVSAQDLDGNNEAYAELIVLGEWGWVPRALGWGVGAGTPFVPSCVFTLCHPATVLGPVACLLPLCGTASHLGFTVPCTPDRTLPCMAFQISQHQSGEN